MREIPLYTLSGVPDADISTHYFSTGDGLGLSMLRFSREPCEDVVLVIHGLTTSSDMFIMPEHDNLVRYLLGNGFTDVWTLDFRMSNRHHYNLTRHRYTMDDCALFDFPAALEHVRRQVGDRRIHVICHCLGSVSFLMALFGKAVHGITSVISNSVSLTPRVHWWSRMKLAVAPFLLEHVMGVSYAHPRWYEDPGLTAGKIMARVVSKLHPECDVPACHVLSFMWGTGFPALYRHENLDEITHRRGRDLFGGTGLHYYRHVRKMVRAGRAVRYRPDDSAYDPLPTDYLAFAGEIATPVLFVTGGQNHVFADSNVATHRLLEELVPGRHGLKVFPAYGHQDVFMGKNVARDVFPTFLTFLNAHRSTAAVASPVA